MTKKGYAVPEFRVVRVETYSVLVASFDEKKDFCADTQCPFNNAWCRDKQQRLNDWRKMVRYYAKNRIDRVFFTTSNQFDNCPYGYNTLCAQHKQKQRG